jgi:hypothetical protein
MEIFSFSDVVCGPLTEWNLNQRFGIVCLLMFPVSFQKWKKWKYKMIESDDPQKDG